MLDFFKIISKTIWNCIITFLIPLLENTSRMQYAQTLWLYALSTRINHVAQFNWTNDKKDEWVTVIVYWMLDLLKVCCNCFLLPLVKKHLHENIIYHKSSFLIEKRSWNLSSLLHNLTSLSSLISFLFLWTLFVFRKKAQQLLFQKPCLTS